MLTIAIVSQKGGSGKTTLAVHLASVATAAGYIACLVDTDPQATAAAWGDWHGDSDPDVVTSPPARLPQLLEKLGQHGAEIVVVDTPPFAEAAAREAVKVADLILIPCRPRAFDLHAIQTTAELAKFSGKPAFVVFNATPPRAPALVADATEMVRGFGLDVAPVSIAERAAFHHSTAAGKSALDIEPNGKAADELNALWKWICQQTSVLARKLDSKSVA